MSESTTTADDFGEPWFEQMARERDEARAERDALRAALRSLLDMLVTDYDPDAYAALWHECDALSAPSPETPTR